MSMLRNLENKLGGLVEGAFGRAFKSNVQPVELARKLAKEMEDNQTVSISRVYVPNHYRVFLSPADREQFTSYEPALRKELSDYLLEHSRQEGLALTSRPMVEFKTDDRLSVGEFGIQAQLLGDEDDAVPAQSGPGPGPSQGDFGHTMVYTPAGDSRQLEPEAPAAPSRAQALLVGEGKRTVLRGSRAVVGRSRDCDLVLDDPNVSRHHAELRREGDGWVVADLGSTNGIKVNGHQVESAALQPGDRVTFGLIDLSFELE
jgi:Protein of unknown function (DUF3662)/FHA domain